MDRHCMQTIRRNIMLWTNVSLFVFLVIYHTNADSLSLSEQCKPCRCQVGESLINTPHTTLANCSKQPLNGIPTHLPTTITQLDLTSTGLKNMSASALKMYPDLEVLILDENEITIINEGSFPDPNFIQILSLSNTEFKVISVDAFKNIPNVKKLSGLKADSVLPGIFKHTPRLQELSLESDHGFSDKLLNDTALKSLDLYLNSSESISVAIFGNSSKTLQELRIIADHLDYLPADLLRNMTTLRKFSIIVADMKELPDKFLGEQEDTYCYISEVSIVGVRKIGENLFCHEPNLHSLTIHASEVIGSAAFHRLSRLYSLDISHNSLSSINPEWFSYITGLKELSLAFNMFTSLNSASLSGLRMLEKLDMSNNYLNKIFPNTFMDVHNTLMDLDLSYNELERIEPRVFNELVSLHHLDLSHNKLKQIEESAFVHLYSLTSIELDSNHISSIPTYTFDSLRGLESLNLSSNAIENLPDGVFVSTPALKILDLSNNRLKSLPRYFLAEDADLDFVDVAQKKEIDFVCDCTLVHLLLGETHWPETMSGKCRFPLHVRDRHLHTLTLSEVCSDADLMMYKKKQAHDINERNRVRTTGKDVTTVGSGGFFGSNSTGKVVLVFFLCFAVPMVVVGAAFLVRKMRGVVFTRSYRVDEPTLHSL